MKVPKTVLIVLNETQWHDSMQKRVMDFSGKYGSTFSFLHVYPDTKKDNKSLQDRILKFKSSITEAKIKILQQQLEFGDYKEVILDKSESMNPDLILIDGGKNNSNAEDIVLKIMPETDCSIWCVERSRTQDINKIICPVDFSETSIKALKNAIVLAKDFNADLQILTVNEITESTSVFIKNSAEDSNKESKKVGEEELNSLVNSLDTKDITIKKKVRLGDPAEEIIEEINDGGADLLVIGTHGRSGIRKKILGSVTEGVVKNVRLSFLTINSRILFIDQ